jgi:hypothetical protein
VNNPDIWPIQIYSHYRRVKRKRSVESQSTPHSSQHGGCPSTQGGTLALNRTNFCLVYVYTVLPHLTASIHLARPTLESQSSAILLLSSHRYDYEPRYLQLIIAFTRYIADITSLPACWDANIIFASQLSFPSKLRVLNDVVLFFIDLSS